MMILKKIWSGISLALTYPAIDPSTRRTIKDDFEAFCRFKEVKTSIHTFVSLFARYPEFRSVVFSRVKNRYRLLPSIFLRGQHACFLRSDRIGSGLVLLHGFSTIINAEHIGKRAIIFQQVTVGYSKGGEPLIGDDCTICCGAVVVGKIRIGNNVTIGAGAVVTHDIPDNAVVAGNPARIIGANDNRHSSFML